MPHCDASFNASTHSRDATRPSVMFVALPWLDRFQRFPNTPKPVCPAMPERQLNIAGHMAQGAVPSGPVFRVRWPNMLECLFASGADELSLTDQFDEARHVIRARYREPELEIVAQR